MEVFRPASFSYFRILYMNGYRFVLRPAPCNASRPNPLIDPSIRESQVWSDLPNLLELLPGVLRLQRRRYNDILSNLPVNRSCHALLVASLQAVDNSQDLGCVAARRRWVHHSKADLLGWVDNEDTADCECDALLIDVRQVLLVDHVVKKRHLAVCIGDDRELQVRLRDVVNVLNPLAMAVEIIGAQPDHLDTSLLELILQLRECPELGRANGREVSGMREQNCPAIVDELVKIDISLRSLCLEVRGS